MKKHATNTIAIVGTGGLVGKEIIKILQEENIKANYIFFSQTHDKVIKIFGKDHKAYTLSEESIAKTKPDFALFAAGGEISQKWIPTFTKYGCIVIDNSSAYRMNPDVPLVVPECNPQDLEMLKQKNSLKIVANPNCSTIGAVVALKPLDDRYNIKRIVYSTYQAISGAGANAKFAYPIENNLIPQIDTFIENGYTKEEMKMVNETKKILGNPDIAITSTAVRVPIANCHSISINVEFKKLINLNEATQILKSSPGIVLHENNLAMPINADGGNEVHVGRIRIDESRTNTLNFFTVSDNIRKGAAYNAIQILKLLIKSKHENTCI